MGKINDKFRRVLKEPGIDENGNRLDADASKHPANAEDESNAEERFVIEGPGFRRDEE